MGRRPAAGCRVPIAGVEGVGPRRRNVRWQLLRRRRRRRRRRILRLRVAVAWLRRLLRRIHSRRVHSRRRVHQILRVQLRLRLAVGRLEVPRRPRWRITLLRRVAWLSLARRLPAGLHDFRRLRAHRRRQEREAASHASAVVQMEVTLDPLGHTDTSIRCIIGGSGHSRLAAQRPTARAVPIWQCLLIRAAEVRTRVC